MCSMLACYRRGLMFFTIDVQISEVWHPCAFKFDWRQLYLKDESHVPHSDGNQITLSAGLRAASSALGNSTCSCRTNHTIIPSKSKDTFQIVPPVMNRMAHQKTKFEAQKYQTKFSNSFGTFKPSFGTFKRRPTPCAPDCRRKSWVANRLQTLPSWTYFENVFWLK